MAPARITHPDAQIEEHEDPLQAAPARPWHEPRRQLELVGDRVAHSHARQGTDQAAVTIPVSAAEHVHPLDVLPHLSHRMDYPHQPAHQVRSELAAIAVGGSGGPVVALVAAEAAGAGAGAVHVDTLTGRRVADP